MSSKFEVEAQKIACLETKLTDSKIQRPRSGSSDANMSHDHRTTRIFPTITYTTKSSHTRSSCAAERHKTMPPGSVPSWAQTASSAALFGGGGTTNAQSDTKPAQSASSAASTTSSRPNTAASNHLASSETQPANVEKPYQPKRKQKPITHCPPVASSSASSSRVPYSIPYVDKASSNEALHQLIAVQAKRAGFDATTASALHEVSQLTKKFLTSVFAAATHAAELSCRGQPSARDLIYALETHGQPIRELRDFHRVQVEDEGEASAKARGKAREYASKAQTFKAKRRTAGRVRIETEEEEEGSWMEGSNAFLPSDSDDGSEMDAWSVSSDSDDEHGNRRAAVQARVAKRKHDLTRRLAKQQRRQAKLLSSATPASDQQNASSSTSSARDLRALVSGEQAWRKIADHIVPRHLPGMPPRHAWVQTPAFPTNAYGSSIGGADEEDAEGAAGGRKKDPLMLVNRKLANARLVEASLRKLIQNTDSAAAVAYASSTKKGGEGSGEASPALPTGAAEKETPAPAPPAGASATSNATASSGGFAVPKTPASSGSGGGLTLRLKSKISIPNASSNSPTTPGTPSGSRRASMAAAFGGGSGVPGTPLNMGFSTGWGGEPLMSPITPVSAAAGAGMMTPYPPTPGGVYGHYFGSNPAANSGGYRSRSQSIAVTGADPYAAEAGANGASDKLGVRVPGPVNYKNVWYAPGSTIGSGGVGGGGAGAGAGAARTTGGANHPRSVKRMRKWKV